MDAYRPIFWTLAALLAWWAVAGLSSANPPDLLGLCLLFAGTAYLCGWGVRRFGESRFAALIVIATALMPWFYYGEMLYLEHQAAAAGIDAVIFAENHVHAVVIYNLMRLIFIILSAWFLVREFFRAIRNF